MRTTEIARVQEYLRKAFNNNRIAVPPPMKADAPVEVYIGDEFLGVLFRDDEDGDLSFNFSMAILDIDLDDH